MSIRELFKKKITPPELSSTVLFRPLKIFLIGIGSTLIVLIIATELFAVKYNSASAENKNPAAVVAIAPLPTKPVLPPLDTAAYDAKMIAIANHPAPIVKPDPAPTAGATTAGTTPPKPVTPPKPALWPVKAPYPKAGAILPFKRIVAYYGNFYSKGMGVLGKYPTEEMLQKLDTEVKMWEAADPSTPVIPAIDYIAVTAQGTPSVGGKYRLRMPDTEIDKAVALADRIHGIVILEIQPGQSTFQIEVPVFEKYLKMPQVHLALDPEFTMHGGAKPGSVIGSVDASDVNWVAQYLANLVRTNDLPPKVLLLHRFTRPMITHTELIKPLEEVQIVMDMDGWGSPAKKIGTYNNVVYPLPVQFTGFKLFYKNDLFAPSTRMLTAAEVLKLEPQPSFIQYQ